MTAISDPALGALSPALEAYARALAGEPRVEVTLARCRALLQSLPGGPPSSDPDPRRGLREVLDALARAGRVRLPSCRSKTGWEREREPALPHVVYLVRARSARASASSSATLHPLLARARDRAPGVRLPIDLLALDAWLKAHGATAPDLPMAERSYEIFGDEKRLDAFLRTCFAADGGLTPADFRAYRVVEPFAMTAFDPGSSWALALENLTTYDSVCRALATARHRAPRPAAVIFGRGAQLRTSCASLPERLPNVHRLVYMGDLDATGLDIPLAVRTTLSSAKIDVVPWSAAYGAMLRCHARPVHKAPRLTAVERLVQFLDTSQRTRALEILLAPARVPQESVNQLALAALLCSSGE